MVTRTRGTGNDVSLKEQQRDEERGVPDCADDALRPNSLERRCTTL